MFQNIAERQLIQLKPVEECCEIYCKKLKAGKYHLCESHAIEKLMVVKVSSITQLFTLTPNHIAIDANILKENDHFWLLQQNYFHNVLSKEFPYCPNVADGEEFLDFSQIYIDVMQFIFDRNLFNEMNIMVRMDRNLNDDYLERLARFLDDKKCTNMAFLVYATVVLLKYNTKSLNIENLAVIGKALDLIPIIRKTNYKFHQYANVFKVFTTSKLDVLTILEILLQKAFVVHCNLHGIHRQTAFDLEVKFLCQMYTHKLYKDELWMAFNLFSLAMTALESAYLNRRLVQAKHLLQVGAKLLQQNIAQNLEKYFELYGISLLCKCIYWASLLLHSEFSTNLRPFENNLDLENENLPVIRLQSREERLIIFNRILKCKDYISVAKDEIQKIYLALIDACQKKIEA